MEAQSTEFQVEDADDVNSAQKKVLPEATLVRRVNHFCGREEFIDCAMKDCGDGDSEDVDIFLPDLVLNKVLKYLNHDDIKSLRSVCFDPNTNAHLAKVFGNQNCFCFDSKSLTALALTSIEGKSWAAASLSGAWNTVRLKHLENQEPDNWLDYFKNNEDYFIGVTELQLKNCVVHWSVVLDVLGCFPNLETFKFCWVEKDYPDGPFQGKDISVILEGLDEEIVLQKTELWKKKYENETIKPISSIKHVTIHVPFLHVVNSLLRVAELRCHCLESLDLAVDAEKVNQTCIQVTGEVRCLLTASELILQNRFTLKKFSFGLRPEWKSQDDIKNFTYSLNAIGVLQNVCMLKDLKLEEFNIGFPLHMNSVAVSIAENDDLNEFVNPVLSFDNPGRPVEARPGLFIARETVVEMLKLFWKNHKETLKIITIDGLQWFKGAEELFEKKVIGNANFKLKTIFAESDPATIPKWKVLNNVMESLHLFWKNGKNFNFVSDIFPTKEPMPLVTSYTFENGRFCFMGWDLPFMLDKFPNLVKLKVHNYVRLSGIGDYSKCGCLVMSDPGTFGAFHVDDEMLQIIIEKLPKLKILKLDLVMVELTDVGITGVSKIALERMKREKCYRLQPGDKVGHSLPKGLTSLSLIGLTSKVTSASVWLTFKNLRYLNKLVLSAPKFTPTSQEFLANTFAGKKNFKFKVYKKGELNRPTTNAVYQQRQ